MKPYRSPLLVSPDFSKQLYIQIDPASAGWEHLHFMACRLRRDQSWSFETGEFELALVVLGGMGVVDSNRGKWVGVGRRPDVFSGMPIPCTCRARLALQLLPAATRWISLVAGARHGRSSCPPGDPHEVEVEIRVVVM